MPLEFHSYILRAESLEWSERGKFRSYKTQHKLTQAYIHNHTPWTEQANSWISKRVMIQNHLRGMVRLDWCNASSALRSSFWTSRVSMSVSLHKMTWIEVVRKPKIVCKHSDNQWRKIKQCPHVWENCPILPKTKFLHTQNCQGLYGSWVPGHLLNISVDGPFSKGFLKYRVSKSNWKSSWISPEYLC